MPSPYEKAQLRLAQSASALASVGGLAQQFGGMVNAPSQINTKAPTATTDALGRPEFNLGGFTSQIAGFETPKGADFSEYASGALQGAAGGAAFGLPGVLIGAGIGAIGTGIAGRVRKKRTENRQRLAKNSLFSAQQMYNRSLQGFNQMAMGRVAYNDMLGAQNRIQNLYTFN